MWRALLYYGHWRNESRILHIYSYMICFIRFLMSKSMLYYGYWRIYAPDLFTFAQIWYVCFLLGVCREPCSIMDSDEMSNICSNWTSDSCAVSKSVLYYGYCRIYVWYLSIYFNIVCLVPTDIESCIVLWILTIYSRNFVKLAPGVTEGKGSNREKAEVLRRILPRQHSSRRGQPETSTRHRLVSSGLDSQVTCHSFNIPLPQTKADIFLPGKMLRTRDG